MQTLKIRGEVLPSSCRSIVFICELDREKKSLEVLHFLQFDSQMQGLNAYANIPNPESQLCSGSSFEDLITEVKALHSRINNPKWIDSLMDCI